LVGFVVLQGGAALALGLVAAGLGDWALRRLQPGPEVRAGLAIAVGLTICGQLGLLLAGAGALRPWVLAPLAAAGAALALPWLRDVRSSFRDAPRTFWVIGLLSAPLFAAALYPPLAFDETTYHLEFVHAFARGEGLDFLSHIRAPVFPALAELIQTELFLFAGDVATHFVSLWAILGMALLLYFWTAAEGDRLAGVLAAAFWLGAPQVLYLGSTDYLDPLLAFFVAGALYAIERGRSAGNSRWCALAGWLIGSAAAVKYLGLFFVGWVGIEAVLAVPRERRRAAGLFAAGAALAAGPTYLRLWLVTGNPLFPFAESLFGASPWSAAPGNIVLAFGELGRWLTLPWDIVFRRQLVGQLPPFTPFVLLAAPLVLAACWREARARRALFFAAVYSLIVPIHSRYLLPALAPLAVIAAREAGRLLATLRVGRARAAATAAVLLLLLPGALWLGVHFRRLGPPPVGNEARDRFWNAQLPLWPALHYLDRTARPGATVYGMYAERMHSLSRLTVTGDHTGELPFERAARLARSPARFHAALRTVGAEYLLWPRDAGRVDAGAGWQRYFERVYSDSVAEVFVLR
jgi:hypothetical protein